MIGAGDGVEASSAAKAGDRRPNVVVIQADDQSLEMMRVMEKTNRLLGDRGATFRNNFTNWPLCCPSRATQLTGQYAHNHRVLGNKPPLGGYERFPRGDNLAVWLEREGYEVGHVGKFLNGYGRRDDDPDTPYNDATEVPPGWTNWSTGSNGSTYTFYGYTQNVFDADDGGPRDGTLVPYGNDVEDHKSDVNTGEALGLIGEYAGARRPFYLQVDYLAPHSGGPRTNPQRPFDCGNHAKPAPRHAAAFNGEPLAALEDEAFNEADVTDKPPGIANNDTLDDEETAKIAKNYECRLESTLAIDEGVADIVKKLRATGELGNTYVFYTSDNGFFHGEHRVKAGKNLVYEEAIRVPLLMRGPEVPKGVNVRDLTSNVDFATTVMALTGASSGERKQDGKSLIPAAQNPRRETGRELVIETNEFVAVRTQRYKWVEYTDGFRELYDLEVDEPELENVASDPAYAEVRERLTARLADLQTCVGSGCTRAPKLEFDFKQVPRGRDCVPEDLKVKVGGADARVGATVLFYARGELVGTDESGPFEHVIRRSKLRGRGDAEIRTEASLVDGRRVVKLRDFDVCR